MGGTSQEQESRPKPESVLANRALLMWLGLLTGLGGGRGFGNLPINQGIGQGGGGMPGGMPQGFFGGGGSPFNANPLAMLPGGQPGPGNVPGTILPNFPAMLGLSGRSFFGSLNPDTLSNTFNQRS